MKNPFLLSGGERRRRERMEPKKDECECVAFIVSVLLSFITSVSVFKCFKCVVLEIKSYLI